MMGLNHMLRPLIGWITANVIHIYSSPTQLQKSTSILNVGRHLVLNCKMEVNLGCKKEVNLGIRLWREGDISCGAGNEVGGRGGMGHPFGSL